MTGNTIDTPNPFELAVEAATTGVLVATADGTIVLVNRELERLFGYPRQALIGQPVGILLPEAPCAPSDGMTYVDVRPIEGRNEAIGRRQDGSRFPVGLAVRPLLGERGTLVLTSVVDVTERSARLAVDEPLAFERLVADVSESFINHPPEEIDRAVGDALRRIGGALSVERGVFYRVGPGGTLLNEVSWTADGVGLAGSFSDPERFPWSTERLFAGADVSFSSLGEIPNETDRRSYLESDVKSAIATPLVVGGRVVGALTFQGVRTERVWATDTFQRLHLVAGVFAHMIVWQQSEASLRTALAEVKRLQDALHVDNTELRRNIQERTAASRVIGRSDALRRAMTLVQQVAPTDSTVLLLGETGTGKELLATEIHALSARASRTMVRVNCAAIPATLIESELFGREKGAFTGALARQVGRFELAHGSTIFLDEVGDLPLETQVKLLRVLQERHIERLGSPQPIAVDTRIIAATHRDLERRIADGTFREDLYYRLNVFPIHVPPLRERLEDIPTLVWGFVEEFAKAFGKQVDSIADESLAALQQYPWPGNLRELRNIVERAMITAMDRRLVITPPQPSAAAALRSPKLVDVERQHIRAVLDASGWRIRGVDGAAVRLGLKPTTLETRMAKLGLKRPRQVQRV